MTPHQRKCHDCGNVAEHADNVTPAVLCKKCGSQDTRLIRAKETAMPPDQSDRKRMELAMQDCMREHAALVNQLRRRFHDEIVVETLIGAATCLVIATVERERVDIGKAELDGMSHALLSKFQNAIDEVFVKHLDSGERN